MNIMMVNIDDATRNRINFVINHAKKNIVTLKQMELANKNNSSNPIGDDENFRCQISDNCLVVYSHEMQPDPIGECRHMSISLITDADIEIIKSSGNNVKIDTLPPPELVQMVMHEFKFKCSLEDLLRKGIVWKELATSTIEAINILEPINPKVLFKDNLIGT